MQFLYFKKDIKNIKILINFNSKINGMIPIYLSKLSIKIYHINIRAQKIDSFIFKIFQIILSSFE